MLAELIIGGSLASTVLADEARGRDPGRDGVRSGFVSKSVSTPHAEGHFSVRERASGLGSGGDLNPRPLGYEPYDARLRRLAWSLVAALTSGQRARHVYTEPRRVSVSRPIRSVLCTNPCTNLVADLGHRRPEERCLSECRHFRSGSIVVAVTWAYARCALSVYLSQFAALTPMVLGILGSLQGHP